MYLPDADLFMSADQSFVAVVQEARRQALFTFADARLIKLANTWTDSVIDALDSWQQSDSKYRKVPQKYQD
jgi:hypothetical protein